jgi:alkanesulfonate monooxygenase SsuD/methylene tetrahydromethanopterin reductase-like flavin-dependent oxidoreductase (luciferase family)
MRVGLQLPSFSFPGGTPAIRPTLTSIAQAAEADSFASLWVMDHFFQLPVDTG